MKPRQIVSIVALLLVTAVGAYYVSHYRDSFARILHVPVAGVLALVVLALLAWYTRAAVLRLAMRELGAEISLLESNMLVWAAFYWNYLPMKPGIYAQAIHMKLRRGLPYSRFAAYLLASNLVGVLLRSTLGLLVTAPLAYQGRLTPIVPAVFGAAALACAAVMAVPTRWGYAGKHSILRALSRAVDAWHEFRKASGLLVRIGLWNLAQVAVSTAHIYLCLSMTSATHSLPLALVIVLVTPLNVLGAIVPGNLGINEALVGIIVMAFGGSATDGVVAATLGRVARLLPTVVLGSIASHRILSQLGPAAASQDEDVAGAPPAEDKV